MHVKEDYKITITLKIGPKTKKSKRLKKAIKLSKKIKKLAKNYAKIE